MKDISLYENVPPEENDLTVKFRVYNNHSALVPHWHEHIELLYFIDGKCTFILDGDSFSVENGDFVVVNSTEIHSFTVERTAKYFCILIYPAFFSDVRFDGTLIKNLIKSDPFIKDCMTEIHAEYESGKSGADMMLKSLTYGLMAYLLRNHSADVSEKEREQKNQTLRRIASVTAYVAASYSGKITTRTLAALCYLSEGHFCRFFKKATGKSPLEYVREFRIDRSTVLLRDTDGSITRIAELVGFDDVNYFSRSFKAVKGISPTEYRRIKRIKNT